MARIISGFAGFPLSGHRGFDWAGGGGWQRGGRAAGRWVGLSLTFQCRLSLPFLGLSLPFLGLSLPFLGLSLPILGLSLAFPCLVLDCVCCLPTPPGTLSASCSALPRDPHTIISCYIRLTFPISFNLLSRVQLYQPGGRSSHAHTHTHHPPPPGRYGRKPLVLVGAVMFSIGGALMALASGYTALIFGRVVRLSRPSTCCERTHPTSPSCHLFESPQVVRLSHLLPLETCVTC